ncbi:MAG: PaaI family thioesterase [Pseudomonadota bacterium]
MTEASKMITWHDPMPTAKLASELSGLEFLSGIVDGTIPQPPITAPLDFALVEVAEGFAVFEGNPAAHHYNPIGTIHGGWFCTIIDSAASCAAHTLVKPGGGYTTLELKVNFVRAITLETGVVRCEGRVIHAGRSVVTSDAKILDKNGKLYGHGTATCMMFQPK